MVVFIFFSSAVFLEIIPVTIYNKKKIVSVGLFLLIKLKSI